ncbi:MAG: glycine rich domain-containing protein, partial [Bacteroidota bacterium]
MFNLFIRELPICKFPFRWMVGMLLMYCCTGLSAQTTVTFNYTGSMQTWTVPPNVFSVEVQAWGAQGGQGETPQAVGGKGGKATGDLAVTPGQALNIFVGGQGQTTSDFSVSGGGWNGGGNARGLPEAPRGGGGGASDVRVGGTTLSNRVIVAGGGGGACTNATRGGAGGGTSGAGGENSGSGTEGDQSSGGSPSTGVACGDGSFGNGGWSSSTNACAGGGGGWYGGGADCGAGGGSGYIGGVSNGQQMVGENFGNGSVWITYYDFPNDICPDPIEIICSQTISGSTVGAGVDNPACSTNGNPGGGLWYSFIGTGQNVTVTTDLPGTDY